MKLVASKARLHHNRMARARIEFGDSFFAGRSAKTRLKLVNRLANPKRLFVGEYNSTEPDSKSIVRVISRKRKSAARKLMVARKFFSAKIPFVSKPVSKTLVRSAGWKLKLKD